MGALISKLTTSTVTKPPTTTTETSTPKCHFLRLPAELRLRIYALVLCDQDIFIQRRRQGTRACEPPLLQTCRLIRVEAMQTYHERLIFFFDILYQRTASIHERIEKLNRWDVRDRQEQNQLMLSYEFLRLKLNEYPKAMGAEREKMRLEGFPEKVWLKKLCGNVGKKRPEARTD